MTTPTSGFRIRLDAFLPCSNTLADMLAASARLEDLRKSMEAAGLVDVKRSDTFVKGTRAKSGPPHAVAVDGHPAGSNPDPQTAPQGAEQGAVASEDLLAVPPFLDRSANRKPAA